MLFSLNRCDFAEIFERKIQKCVPPYTLLVLYILCVFNSKYLKEPFHKKAVKISCLESKLGLNMSRQLVFHVLRCSIQCCQSRNFYPTPASALAPVSTNAADYLDFFGYFYFIFILITYTIGANVNKMFKKMYY